jgi:uncharacterized membrane protein YphA (DoxX/SURF4 family)
MVFEESLPKAKQWKNAPLALSRKQKSILILELLAGALLLIGFFTQLAALLLLIRVAFAHFKKEGFLNMSDQRFFALLVAVLFALVAAGGGLWSADEFFGIILY